MLLRVIAAVGTLMIVGSVTTLIWIIKQYCEALGYGTYFWSVMAVITGVAGAAIVLTATDRR